MFDGLDTYCTITLNGKNVATTSNMFMAHRVDVASLLKASNSLELRFAAPLLAAKKEEAENGGPMALWNGDSSRLYSRKAQYGWGWDWGPIIMTVGPWKDVHLETYTTRIENVRVDTDVSGNKYDRFSLKVSDVQIAHRPAGSKVVYTLTQGDEVVQTEVAEEPHWDLSGKVKAWYPIYYGEQPLYTLEAELIDTHGRVLSTWKQRVGFRDVQIVQEAFEDQEGSSFLFQVNGIRVFCGGSNWIPGDNYLTEMTEQRYRDWVDLLVLGNQNMLRVWAGGVYEDQALYDACDEKGILVWQDFMFGCGLYPSYDKINASIKMEAEQAVTRLRQHPSVVIFAGNNEDYQIAEEQGVVDYNDKSGDYMHTKFPG